MNSILRNNSVIHALLLVFAGMAALVLGDMLVSSLAGTANGPLYRSVLRFMIGAATLAFLIRAGWGKASGVTRLTTTGKRWWWIAFLPLSFFLLANLAGVDWSSLRVTPGSLLAWIGTNVSIGFVEESLYRGLLLFILLRAWGRTRSGLMAACVVQALLFGSLHVLNLLGGAPLIPTIFNAVFATIVGMAFGAAYAYSGSLWTCIVLHAAIDMAGSMKEAFGTVEHVAKTAEHVAKESQSLSVFIPSLVVIVFVSLLPSVWFAYRSDLHQENDSTTA